MFSDCQPIFIVGCPRSGTTLLRLILDSHSNISCGPETKFLDDLKKITKNHWERLERYGFEREYWKQKIAQFFCSFQQEYANKRGKKRWADKTPQYVKQLEFIDWLFPSCQIIHIIRDGRDVVASHHDRWGYKSAIEATRLWPDCVSSGCNYGKKLPKERYLEIRYEDLVAQPEVTLRDLFNYLQEPWEPEVLEYEKFSHDDSKFTAQLTDQRRQSSKDFSTIYTAQVGAGKQTLDPFLKALLNRRANHILKKLGYQ